MRTPRHVRQILNLLTASHGRVTWKCWGRPLDVLVETILSQNTSNANSSAGYKQLRRRFRTWKAVADAPVGEVEKCIRVSGLSRIKAPRIQKILRQIRENSAHQQVDCRPSAGGTTPSRRSHGGNPHGLNAVVSHARRGRDLSLDFLRDMPVERADEYLQSFDGVGPKTAACVLMFSFNMPIFPVDTHIHRISIRLKLVPKDATAEEVQQLLTPLIASGDRYAMHILLIAHGRKTCRARSPRCEWCGLAEVCAWHGRLAHV